MRIAVPKNTGMDFAKGHAGAMVLLLLGLVFSSCVLMSYSSFLQLEDSFTPTSITIKDELEIALEAASMENKILIISIVNNAYAKEGSILDLFLHSFKVGQDTQMLLNHLLLVAVDQIAFDRCNLLHLHCYKLVTDGVDFSREKTYMSQDFIKMMWTRTLFLADVLRHGYSFIFTDADIMWLRNPFGRLLSDGGEDLRISCDTFNGRPSDTANPINTGFYFVASTNKTIALFDKWYAFRNESLAMKEQDILVMMVQEGVLQQLDLKVRLLDTSYFGGFCERPKDFTKVLTMHANCCLTIKAKIMDIRALFNAWYNFRRSSSNSSSTIQVPRPNTCFRSWLTEPN